ncbi:MAG: L-dopachrome tautomerase-related protein [Candidatus Nitrosocosmicus sp.]|jgi:sugar lactone lactonase YvrE|nr:major royal jelly family protein [Candidatus Nitrosocosmicus sp.]
MSNDIPSVELPSSEPLGALEPVAFFNDAMPTGVAVSHTGRIFVNFPKWGDDVKFTVSEIRNGQPVAYPDESINEMDQEDQASKLVSVQSVVIDPADRLWILDTGSPLFKPTEYGGPKLICVNLDTNKVVKKILFPQTIAQPTTYLNDVRFDLRRGKEGIAFITDSSQKGANSIIVVDLHSGESWRRLNDHPSTKSEDIKTFLPLVEGRPFLEHKPDGTIKHGASMGADGIAINADGSRLYYCPLGSRKLYSVATDALVDRDISEEEVASTIQDHGDRGGASDGLESDSEGNIYSTNYEHNAILQLRYSDKVWETVAYDPRLLWPDTLCLATDGYLYVTSNQLHRQARYNKGKDLRIKPYVLFRVRVNAKPVLLR